MNRRAIASPVQSLDAADREAEIRKSHGNKRVWRLAGFYMEELSLARYTLREIESWIDWDAYNLRHNHADVKIIGDVDGAEYCIDVSGHFANPCNDRVSTPNFDKLATRLRDYVQQRRENAAGNN